jgi:hypothetical protein
MGSEVLRVATRVCAESWAAPQARPVSRPARLRVDHWIVAFWVLVGAAGFYHFTVTRPSASSAQITAMDGGLVPPSAR